MNVAKSLSAEEQLLENLRRAGYDVGRNLVLASATSDSRAARTDAIAMSVTMAWPIALVVGVLLYSCDLSAVSIGLTSVAITLGVAAAVYPTLHRHTLRAGVLVTANEIVILFPLRRPVVLPRQQVTHAAWHANSRSGHLELRLSLTGRDDVRVIGLKRVPEVVEALVAAPASPTE